MEGSDRYVVQRMIAGLVAVSLAVTACSPGGATSPSTANTASSSGSVASCVPSSSSAGSYASASTAAGADAPALLVLAACEDGTPRLWSLDAKGGWTTLGSIPGGEAIARDDATITIARSGSLETRSVARPGATLATLVLKWPGSVPTAPIRAIDSSPSGSTAIVTADEHGQTYSIASPDGIVNPLTGAPESSFAPLFDWIDANRALALSEGTDATSRIVVLTPQTGGSEAISTLLGVRWLALSRDRSTVAVALDAGIYVSPVSALLNGEQPAWVGSLGPSQSVLDLVVDQTGDHLAALVTSTRADGTSDNIRELSFSKTNSGWTRTYDAPVPFATALGQVWLG